MKEPGMQEADRKDSLLFELPLHSPNPGLVVCRPYPKDRRPPAIPKELVRKEGTLEFPSLDELSVVRHFTSLSQKNFSVDTHFYPLGSCTMKYNPKAIETLIPRTRLSRLHPYMPHALLQGLLQTLQELEHYLMALSGMDAVSLQPSAGAQGELAGLLIIKAYLQARNIQKTVVLIPDTAHGTNPASSSLAGFKPVVIPSGPNGILEPSLLDSAPLDDTAAIMITNPNTLGLFEAHMPKIAERLHARGALVYMDGANLNPLLGFVQPRRLGADIVHFNLHKTFGAPHGGGGPGAGPIGVVQELSPYLPVPRIENGKEGLSLQQENPESIGRLRAFFGNVLVLLKAWVYIRLLGLDGLRNVAMTSILNANYVKERLKGTYHLPFDTACMHECVFSDRVQAAYGIKTADIAKRLLDYGFHPPTIAFPLIVPGALMIEPTETETLETIEAFLRAMEAVAKEAEEAPEVLRGAPYTTPVSRVDEVRANREPRLVHPTSQEKKR
jgi:glycine dehydrogenase subunit 2